MLSSQPISESQLSQQEQAVLEFAARAPRALGAREHAIRQELGQEPVAYYQQLNRLLDDPRALAAYPVVVNRLRRIRNQRAENRRASSS